MRKLFFKGLKSLLITALAVGFITACEEDKPSFDIPGPTVPQKEFRHIESLIPDTLAFTEGDSAVFSVRTIPYNYLSRDSLTVQIADSAGNEFPHVWIKSYNLNNSDSTWNIVMFMKNDTVNGKKISIMAVDKDTTIYSEQTVLKMIPKPEPIRYSLTILNKDSVAAFLNNDLATIRLNVEPWNALFNQSFSTLSLTDTTGSATDAFAIDSILFRQDDGYWDIKVKVLDNSLKDGYVCVKLTNPDTTVVAPGCVNIKKVSFSMIKVTYGKTSKELKYNSTTMTYSWCLPAVTQFGIQRFFFEHSGDKITLGDSVLTEGVYNKLDVTKPITISVWKYDLHKDYTIKFYNTGLPVVNINTNGQAVTRRDTWVPGATMRIELPDGTVDYEGTLSLKGRGNQTWSDFDKKPYALKLDEKAKILGMHKQKRWVLLANVKDRTLLRNDVAFWISRQTNIGYTVNGQFVELVWNGKHMGNYYLCEQIKIDNNRIDIHEPNLEEPEKGGYFMRIDAFLDYKDSKWADKGKDLGFWSSRYNMPYIFKDPDEDEEGNMLSKSSLAYTYMYNYVSDMEAAISKASSTNHEWANYLDAETAVAFALIQEIMMNHDAYNSWPKNGPKSTYLYKDSAGLMCFDTVWDFDYHTLTYYHDYESDDGYINKSFSKTDEKNPRLERWEILKMTYKGGNSYYFSDLKRDPQFKSLLVQRWNQYKVVWGNGFNDYVDQMAAKIRLSESYNEEIWHYKSKQNGDWTLTFDEAIQALKDAFAIRLDWIDRNIGNL